VSNKYNKIIKIDLPVRTRRARPKGRKFSNVSISLTQEQIDWLQKQPNASEIIRKLLDDLIAAGKDVEAKLEVVSLNSQLKELEKQKQQLLGDRFNYIYREKAHCWKRYINETQAEVVDWLDQEHEIPKPKDDEESQIAFRVVKSYDDAIKVIELKIADVKAKILKPE
jgi:hypothetical protein